MLWVGGGGDPHIVASQRFKRQSRPAAGGDGAIVGRRAGRMQPPFREPPGALRSPPATALAPRPARANRRYRRLHARAHMTASPESRARHRRRGPPASAPAGRGAQPMVVVIAAPNGAGKTAFAMKYLPDEAACPHLVNTDSIAAGLSPYPFGGRRRPRGPYRAAGNRRPRADRRKLRLRDDSERARPRAPDSQMALARLSRPSGRPASADAGDGCRPSRATGRAGRSRRAGGSDSPAIFRGWRNFEILYRDSVDEWKIYDNAGKAPAPLAEGGRG